MEGIINAEKSWEWSHKIRNASLEKAEQMLEESAIDTKHKVGQVKSFYQFFILRFSCEKCRDYHFWGGTKKYMLCIDFSEVCPKKGVVHLNKKFDYVPRYDAMQYCPKDVRKLIYEDEFEENPFK